MQKYYILFLYIKFKLSGVIIKGCKPLPQFNQTQIKGDNMRNTTVALKICTEYANQPVFNALKQGFDLLGGLSAVIKPSHKVLIKPDLYCSSYPNEAKTTNPNIVSALAELVAKIGAKCTIADSPKGNFNPSLLDKAYVKTQMLEASNNGNASLNTNHKISTISNPNGKCCRDIYIIDAVNEADVIINVGKLRCDKNLGLIGCSQNLFGLIPGKFKNLIKSRCYELKSYYNYAIDLYEALEDKIVLNVLDGIVGNEANGDPRILNTLIVGENPYAVDAVALKIINQKPENNPLLIESTVRNKFEFNNTVLGDNLNGLICSDFKYPKLNSNVTKGSQAHFKRLYKATQKRPLISSKLCKGCNVCTKTCPMKAISMQKMPIGDSAIVNYTKCISCFKCVDSCPYKIIKTKTPLRYAAIDRMIKKVHSDKR